ncbi:MULTISPECIES: large conductance mechanosensitive channel protein MscL [Hymenobacter]|uniref:Large-conductance mechanosensitive channel n=1 Tax=Hymenobacter jejuensis TaxID=2502781 RepID=A0A5B8A1L0_9BACT|nr:MULTISPECIES: large conductance mechanosensitive channel protein MscL [Hymenobacter]MBC6990985.1 large conductance mechanosensitive channel protein MscL [Hymenobacter sp. BT491]QDA60615.1 large conductance mechanosensitive channel protein MscL [Hymenobacter jejuensis]
MGLFSEFKEFVSRGNVLDLAVGVIIGAAFGKIVTSLVDDILMPILGKISGGHDFSDLFVSLDGTTYASLKQAKDAGAATLNYGLFLNAVLNFLIIAFCIFLIVQAANKLRRKPDPAPEAEPAPTKDQILLMEIRDSLRTRV